MISIKQTLKPGYSFIELMVYLLVIMVLLSFAVPQVMKLLGKSKTASTKNTLKIVKAGIESYRMTVGHLPDKIEDLIIKPENASNWDGPYAGDENLATPELPQDAWDQPLKYEKNERGAKPPFKLWSEGDPEKEDDRIDA